MSRAGEEMVQELARLLNTGMDKTAAKKDDEEKKPCKCGKDCDCGCEGDSEKCKCEKKKDDDKKKASTMMSVVNDLVKLANELDEAGADEASGLVDDALKVILEGLNKE